MLKQFYKHVEESHTFVQYGRAMCLPESKSTVDVGELGRGESEWNPPEKRSSLTENWEPGSSLVRRDDDRPCFKR